MFRAGVALILAAAFSVATDVPLFATTFQTIDYGLGTVITGTDGDRVVGYAGQFGGYPTAYSFVLPVAGGTPTKLPAQNIEQSALSPFADGISGNLVYGNISLQGSVTLAGSNGFVYDLSTQTYRPVGDTSESYVVGISGNIIVGAGKTNTSANGFRYDGTSYTDFSAPAGFGSQTIVTGVSGDEIVGYGKTYTGNPFYTYYPFLFDGVNWQHLVNPNAQIVEPMAVSENLITGIYYDLNGVQHGFLYDGTTWTNLDDVFGIQGLRPMGISGDTIVGSYEPNLDSTVGFIATVPEPSGLILAGCGVFALLGFCRSRAWNRSANRLVL